MIDKVYVNGQTRRILRNGPIHWPSPYFSSIFWHICTIYRYNENGIARTQNKVGSGHKRWTILIGSDLVSCLHIISEMKIEEQHT